MTMKQAEKRGNETTTRDTGEEDGLQRGVSRRKLLAAMGAAGVLAATEGMLTGGTSGLANGAQSVTANVYGDGNGKSKKGLPWTEDDIRLVSIASLRLLTGPSTDVLYYVTDRGQEGCFYYDAEDTVSTDNTGTVLVSTASNARFKRIYDREVNVAWFGAKLDGIADDRAALMAAIATGKQVIVPSGTFVANLLPGDVSSFLAACNRIHWFCTSWVVNLPVGVTTESQRTEVNMTNASRGQIRGAAPIALTFASLGAQSSVGSGNHSITVNFTDASQVSVGDFILCRSLTGTTQALLRGMWEVTGKTGNAVILKVKARIAALPALNVTGGTFYLMRTVIKYSGNHTGLYVRCRFGDSSQYLDGVRDLALVGPGTGAASVGIFVEGGCTLNMRYEIGVANFGSHGVEGIYGSVIRGQNTVSSGNEENGYYALAGCTMEVVGSSSTGNGTYGYVDANGSNLSFGSFCAAGNANGVFVDGVSSAIGDNGFVEDNATLGAFVAGRSKARIRSASVKRNQSGLRVNEVSTIDFNNGMSIDNTLNAAIIQDFGSSIVGGTLTGTVRRNGTPAQIVQGSGALNFGSVGAGAESKLTLSVPGVTTTKCNLVVNSNVNTDGVFFDAWVSTADTVTVRAHNRTAGSISVSNRTFYITAFLHP